MVAVNVVQMTVNQVIDMIAVRHHGMTAARTMDVIGGMAATTVGGRASGRVGAGNLHGVFLHLPTAGEVQMTIVKVIDVVAMTNAGMAAARPVLMRVIGMSMHLIPL
jgi:hypothetical protein